jgi:diguanylate cyclase (GGDEF)-like protein
MKEITRSERYNLDFSLAIIDLDNFKNVNDTYGHQTGDQVIKSLSRMLKQRLRETDIVGRIGGEEFAIIFLGIGSDRAFKVMDELRNHFSRIEHQDNQRKIFFLTFSCGITQWRPGLNNTQIHTAADKALYQAKSEGKNRIIIG